MKDKNKLPSQYKYVTKMLTKGKWYWRARAKNRGFGVLILDTGEESERLAGKEVDIQLIKMGEKPVNILKPLIK